MRYRKKPVVVDAWRIPDRGEEPSEALKNIVQENDWAANDEGIAITTLEGTMLGLPGDFLIRGVKGEYYPCKPDIFHATYEAVGEEDE